ncbi:MAG: hypothetical protein JXB05_19820 [Myxococcaceae bacterium]|nr:hypothetical protein [Myxococcaceae bacterium]
MSAIQPPGSVPLAPRRTPEPYIRAEIASFPLASLKAFRHAMVELNPELDTKRGRTRELWMECEEKLSQHASGWSLDRLILARDFFWFGEVPGRRRVSTLAPVSLRRYLRNLAKSFLEARPGLTELFQSTDANAFDASLHYRWLTFALPEDLLLSATCVEPPPTHVSADPPLLHQQLVDTGVAEIHHHIGAGMDFSLLWASLQAELADPLLTHGALDSPALPFGSEQLLSWLLAAAIARCVLAEFLIHRGHTAPAQLQDFVESLSHFPVWSPPRLRALHQTLRALAHGTDAELPDFYQLHDLYGELHPVGTTLRAEPPETLDEVWRVCDPIAVRLELRGHNGGERWLMRHGLAYLAQQELQAEQQERRGRAPPGDTLFARLFWQALRMRCIYYRTVIQRPMTAGLQWFTRFAGRLGWVRTPLHAARAEISFHVAGRGEPLRALEVRIPPGDTSFILAGELQELLHSWRNVIGATSSSHRGLGEPEFGVVVHILKERDPQLRWAAGAPPAGDRYTHAEPQPLGTLRMGGRYADYFSNQAVRARAMVHLLRAVPRVLWLLRGLDVASDELGEPTWVLVPLYRYVHSEANLAATAAAARLGHQQPPPLRLTAHVGEDFRHLMEGLRHIFECMHYLLGHSGGRLGHATALGVEPYVWAQAAGSVMMTAEDRLWDLVFEWRLYSSYAITPDMRAEAPTGRPEQVENLIRQLSSSIFRHSYEPQVLAELHHVLHLQLCRPVARVPAGGSLDGFSRAVKMLDPEHVRCHSLVSKLLTRYREDEQVFLRGQEPVDITVDGSEIAALYAVQNALRRAVGLRGLVVEVNPSSNLLIGDLLDLRNHPVLRLYPPQPEDGAPPPVPIAVGSDDPIIFSTWLMREYTLLYEAALSAGYPERTVHDWLQRIRRMGLDSRFTVPWPPGLAQRLEDELGDYLQRSRLRRTVH